MWLESLLDEDGEGVLPGKPGVGGVGVKRFLRRIHAGAGVVSAHAKVFGQCIGQPQLVVIVRSIGVVVKGAGAAFEFLFAVMGNERQLLGRRIVGGEVQIIGAAAVGDAKGLVVQAVGILQTQPF